MNAPRRARWLSLLLLGALAGVAWGTTWGPRTVTCPLCGTPNTFQAIMSYGTYIYRWASKYQYVFWPFTVSESLYSCRKCHLTCFMADFRKVPEEKKGALRKALDGVKLDKAYAAYTDIPIARRLEIAEKVYRVLGRDDDFWCWFYRVVGYHLAEQKRAAEAAEARKKALGLARKLLQDESRAGQRKETLYICGALNFLLKNWKDSQTDFAEAAKLRYENRQMADEEARDLDAYLSKLIEEYPRIIAPGKEPKQGAPE